MSLMPVLVVSTSLGGICGLTITPTANIAVAMTAAPANRRPGRQRRKNDRDVEEVADSQARALKKHECRKHAREDEGGEQNE